MTKPTKTAPTLSNEEKLDKIRGLPDQVYKDLVEALRKLKVKLDMKNRHANKDEGSPLHTDKETGSNGA